MKSCLQFFIIWTICIFHYGFSSAQNLEKWFPGKEAMRIGVQYSPEQWPENQWERELKNISSHGFLFVQMGESAWSFLEPEEGKFDFTRLDKAIDLAAKNGLKVILSTPTAAPPVWLSKKYPEALMQNAEGVVQQHGSRQHGSWSSAKYRDLCSKIVTEMSKKFGQDTRIWGWQIDNEPSHYGIEYDYSPAANQRFIEWLRKKYNRIDSLNEVWGTSFWGLSYGDFEQIRIPNARELPQQANPHAVLDFKRFSAAECAGFISFQAAILRQNISKDQWLTSNFISYHAPNDPFLNKDLDFLSFSAFPAAGNAIGFGQQGFRLGSPSALGMPHDYFRSLKGKTAISELQSGQMNWGRYNPQPLPGAVRLWLYQAFGSGSAFVSMGRYRQTVAGAEQYHAGITGPDGLALSRGGEELTLAMKELADLKKQHRSSSEYPARLSLMKTGILYSRDNIWDQNYQRQTLQWNAQFHIAKYYEVLRQLQIPVDFAEEDADFSKFSFLIVPAYQLTNEKLISKLQKFAEKGGEVIISCRFGQKDKNGRFPEAPFQAGLKKLAGIKVRFFDVLPDDAYGKVAFGGKNYEWNNWAEVLEPEEGTQSMATYADQFYKGSTAVSGKKTGKGNITCIGVETDPFLLEKEIIKAVYQKALDRPLEELPSGLEVLYRDGFWLGLNFHSTEVRKVPVPEKGKILMGEKDLKPGEVVIWTE